MSAKYSFNLSCDDAKREMPRKIIIAQQESETIVHVALKLLGFLLFSRPRLQIETNLHMDSIPFIPDIVQLNYELRPVLWVECGECGVNKLNKLAVKIPDSEIWIIRRSPAAAEELIRQMEKAELRRNRYSIIGFDPEMFEEICGLIHPRNDVSWVRGTFDPTEIQFDFNGLWFDAPFSLFKF
jgi:uncharacterized protein YaeQ